MIVPVNLSYDRIYESRNLTNEMIGGTKQCYSVFDTLNKIWNLSKDAIGDVYVKYLEPINLHDYLNKIDSINAEKVVKPDYSE